MHRTKLTTVAFVAAIATLSLTAPQTHAQPCGDPDNSADITEADGVNALRAAANVSSPCSNATCDINGDGVINDVDGVNMLRAAMGLSATLDCVSAEVNEIVSEVETGDDDPPAQLRVGAAPIPGAGAVDTIGAIEGNTTVVPGSSNTMKVPYDATAQAAQAAHAAGVDLQELDLKMIIAINDMDGVPAGFLKGFFEIPLDTLIGEVTLTTFFPQGLGERTFLFCPATRFGTVLSNYGALSQEPVSVSMGQLQVSLSFTPHDVDVDLALVEPAPGEKIYYDNLVSSVTGGMLDLDSGYPCGTNAFGNENITYPAQESEPLPGQYVAQVMYAPGCDPQSTVDWTVVINTNGSTQTVTGSFLPTETGPGFERDIPFTFTPQP